MKIRKLCAAVAAVSLLACSAAYAQDTLGGDMPRPDDKPADMSKPVKVFIIMGQSNAVGAGKVSALEKAVKEEKAYPFLVDEAGNWTTRNDVWNTQVMVGKGGGMNTLHDEPMTVKGKTMGIEFGVGHKLGNALEEPVLILKSCIGNRALGWDLLPPGSESYEWEVKDKKTGETKTMVYAGYKATAERWEKGTDPKQGGWYAGKQYDDDVANAKKVLAELDKRFPDAKGYEVAGFFWWQGERDAGDAAHAANYEKNLVNLIASLRKDFNAPNANFVIGTIGEAKKDGPPTNTTTIMNAMFNVDGEKGKYPEYKGNVATVYTHEMARGGSGNGHYGGNPKVYMDVGLSMGDAMVKLLKD